MIIENGMMLMKPRLLLYIDTLTSNNQKFTVIFLSNRPKLTAVLMVFILGDFLKNFNGFKNQHLSTLSLLSLLPLDNFQHC